MKAVSFVPGSLRTAASRYVRHFGRPRKEWITTVLPEALRLLPGDANRLVEVAQDAKEWRAFIRGELSEFISV